MTQRWILINFKIVNILKNMNVHEEGEVAKGRLLAGKNGQKDGQKGGPGNKCVDYFVTHFSFCHSFLVLG
jgi:hypothetical protein